ncbi:MAG: hypothetical protein HFACDABA_00052 [Anaerolineales bacterium]|nr:hypothetical protein [Anaerolineales bacterium]
MTFVKQSEYQALAAFRYSLRQFLRFSEEAARAVGLAPQQHQALLAIKGFPSSEPVTIGALAERLQIRHHSAVELVNRLASERLVEREHSKQDRRHVFVRLTARGLDILEKLSAAHKQELRRLGPQLRELLSVLSDD